MSELPEGYDIQFKDEGDMERDMLLVLGMSYLAHKAGGKIVVDKSEFEAFIAEATDEKNRYQLQTNILESSVEYVYEKGLEDGSSVG